MTPGGQNTLTGAKNPGESGKIGAPVPILGKLWTIAVSVLDGEFLYAGGAAWFYGENVLQFWR